ncbi:hypothetical protein Tco_0181810, partial [Tanacetum coccineum]
KTADLQFEFERRHTKILVAGIEFQPSEEKIPSGTETDSQDRNPPERLQNDLRYRLRGETTTSTVYLSNRRAEDHFFMAELYQFTSNGSSVDLEIDFDDHGTNLRVEGILFQPLEIVR